MIKLLLENQSPLNATDISGYTALHHGKSFKTPLPSAVNEGLAIAEGNGDAALELLKAGADTDKRDVEGKLAIDLAPDTKVSYGFKELIKYKLTATVD